MSSNNAYTNYACPICGGEGIFWHKIDIHELNRCVSCGFVYVRNILSVSELANMYEHAYKNNGTYRETIISRGRKLKYRTLGRLIQFIARQSKIKLLDIGCGEGRFLEELSHNKHFEAEGIDYSQDTVEYARSKGLKVIQSSLEDIQFPPETFDFMTAFHVIEHVHRLDNTIQEIRRVMKKGGHIWIVVPCISHIKARVAGKKWTYLHPPTHYWFFTTNAMKLLLKKHGFIVKIASCISNRDHLTVLAKKA